MPEGIPSKVEQIAKAIRRDNPDFDDEKAYKMAWAKYKEMGTGKGEGDRCWDGYEPVPGKKPYSDDSCRPVKKEKAGMGSGYGGSGGHGIHYPAESWHKPISLDPYYSYITEVKEFKPVEETLEPRHHTGTMRDDIVRFFTQNPYPNDYQVHAYATELGLSHEELEKEIYALLSDLIQDQGMGYKGS